MAVIESHRNWHLSKKVPLIGFNTVHCTVHDECLICFVQMLVLQCNAPLELVRFMQTQMYEKLLWTTSRLLKVLSVDQQNKAAIVAAGGIHALARHLLPPAPANAAPGAPSARLLHNCLWTLRNLSDVATRVEGIEPVLERLIQLLALNTGALAVTPAPAPDLQVIACCAGILSNLTCNNQANKVAVCHLRGIETLVHTIKLAGPSMRDEILEPTVRLTHRTMHYAGCAVMDMDCTDTVRTTMYGYSAATNHCSCPLFCTPPLPLSFF